jgi:hypothetical protein
VTLQPRPPRIDFEAFEALIQCHLWRVLTTVGIGILIGALLVGMSLSDSILLTLFSELVISMKLFAFMWGLRLYRRLFPPS